MFIRQGQGRAFIDGKEIGILQSGITLVEPTPVEIPEGGWDPYKEYSGSFTMTVKSVDAAFFEQIFDFCDRHRKRQMMQSLREIAYERFVMNSLWPDQN